MYMQDVIGELLYIGIVAEKGRCYGTHWKYGYKKILFNHIVELYKLQQCLSLQNLEAISAINSFIEFCESNVEIRKFYNFSCCRIVKLKIREENDSFDKVNELIRELFVDLIKEMSRVFIRKKEIYDFLSSLHNLLRIYLGVDKNTLCNLRQPAISEEDAVKYAFQNMNETMKIKYQKYINLVKIS